VPTSLSNTRKLSQTSLPFSCLWDEQDHLAKCFSLEHKSTPSLPFPWEMSGGSHFFPGVEETLFFPASSPGCFPFPRKLRGFFFFFSPRIRRHSSSQKVRTHATAYLLGLFPQVNSFTHFSQWEARVFIPIPLLFLFLLNKRTGSRVPFSFSARGERTPFPLFTLSFYVVYFPPSRRVQHNAPLRLSSFVNICIPFHEDNGFLFPPLLDSRWRGRTPTPPPSFFP